MDTGDIEKIFPIGLAYLIVGLFVAVMDLLTFARFGFITSTGLACTQSGDVACLSNFLVTFINFLLDIVIGPLLLAANIMNNPALGFFGIIIGLIILYFCYDGNNAGGSVI